VRRVAEPVSSTNPATTDAARTSGSRDRGASRLVSATALMAAGTGVSRVLGFVKAALVIVALGNGTRQGDMLAISQTVPQAIYLLLAGGVLNTVFVPQIVRAMKEQADGGEAYINRLLTLGLSAIGIITIGATLLAPVVMGDIYINPKWKVPGLSGQFDSIILLSYVMLPQIFFYGMYVMVGQVLNARGRFGPMMWAPIANNIVGIASLLLFQVIWHGHHDTGAAFTSGQIAVLGLGTTLGIVAQAVILVPYMHRAGYRFRPRFDFRNSGLGRAGQVAKWTVGYMIVTQLALVVVTRLANGATVGGHGAGWNVYSNANLIFMLPHSLITVSLTTAMLPSTSRLVVAGDLAGARDEAMRTMRLAVTALLPASVAFLALGFPIAHVLFGLGNGAAGWPLISWTLMAFAVGLVPFTLQYVCLRAFYALEDTRTTFFVQILIASVNVAAALALVLPVHKPDWVAPGLALAYALAYIIGLGVSFTRLARRLPGLSGAEIARHCLRVLAAVLPAGVVAYAIVRLFALWSSSWLASLVDLAVAGPIAIGIYLAMARVLKIAEVNQIVSTVLRRTGRSGKRSAGSLDIDSQPSGNSAVTGDPESGTIETGTAGATPIVQAAVPAFEDESLVVTRIGQRIENAAGQQRMAGGQSEQAAGTAPDRTGESPAEQTAPFSLDELRADGTAGRTAAENSDHRAQVTTPVSGPVPGPPAPPRTSHPADLDHLPAGTVLGDRYRLEELLAGTTLSQQTSRSLPSAMVWRAFDQVLSRSVVIHLLEPGDPRGPALLAAGRRAAGATDSRFLRVLDAVEEGARAADGRTVGSYIVSEYAAGQSLQAVLSAAPLTGLESAWVVREVADALSGAHARGLFHRRLIPDLVIITPAGNIKLVGLLIEAALRPEQYPAHDPGAAALEATDVCDLGRLLYACLVARWPGDGVEDLPAAPAAASTAVESGHPWLTPRQVRHGVSPVLDRICDQLLSPVPRQRAPRITTAAALVGELDRVLGSADATGDLERRLRHPQPSVLVEDPEVAAYSAALPEAEPYALIERNGSIAAGTNTAERVATPQSPNRPPAELARPRSGPRSWLWLLVIVLLIAALVATVLTARGLGPASSAHHNKPTAHRAATRAGQSPTASTPIRIVGAHDFDPAQGNPPQGGNGQENPGLVKYAYDGNKSTDWHTLSYYNNPKLGGLKKGVGIVFDLGAAKTVGEVRVQLTGVGTDLQLRVPKGGPTVNHADMNSLKSWRTVAQQKGAGGSAILKPNEQIQSRYVLVFLTSLPKEGANYRGGIYEAEVLS